MDNTKIFYFVIGGAIGGLTGYLIADYFATRIHNSRFEPEEELPNGWFPGLAEEDGDIVVLKTGKSEAARTIVDYASARNKEDLSILASKYTSEENEDTEEEKIFVITRDQYEADLEFGKHSMTFYANDGVFVTNIDQEMVINPEEILGEDAPYCFGLGKDVDPDIGYIRNKFLVVDYEITRVYESFQVEVLGDEPEPELPPKPKKRPRRARRAAKPKKDIVDEKTGEVSQEDDEA